MDDLISRQAAIDMLKNRWKKTRHYEGIGDDIAEECELYLKQVPSAQPSVSKEEMVGDTISRQAAIHAICRDGVRLERGGALMITISTAKQWAVDLLGELPSAQPERIKGHWVEIASSNHTYKCSVCGRLLVNITDGKNNVAKNYPYCHCGADMRGKQDE